MRSACSKPRPSESDPMASLLELQRAVGAHVLAAPSDAPAALLDSLVLADGLTAAARLEIHRSNTVLSLRDALKETFPVVCRLVGEEFFGFAARQFVRTRPPLEARLAAYGASFAGFLESFEPARALAYLPDTARLEWAVNQAFHAADGAPLDPAPLARLGAEQSAGLRFALHPSCTLFASAYPVLRIWEANQPDIAEPDPIDLAQGGCRLLVYRRALDVRFVELEPGTLAFLAALGAGETLDAAFGAAVAVEAGFDLAAALQLMLAQEIFTAATIPEDSA